ncbi:MAG: monovalent cation/H+ antiporter complex subunit F [Defluviitaleaceae bacterium]|nr:monovalent cation/H+ antiporter complex subunit F [Defluviitaleaceae bacterium]
MVYLEAVQLLLQLGIMFLAITMCLCLIRAVKGPKMADRIIAINMICVKTILMIVMVGVMIGDMSLVDIALVYALLSFLAVVILTRFMLQAAMVKSKQAGEAGRGDVKAKPQ